MVQLTTPTGNAGIKYEFRQNRILLIFTTFNDERLIRLVDLLEEGCNQIEESKSMIRYDEGIGAIIILMKVGYDSEAAHHEISEVFEFMFSQQADA